VDVFRLKHGILSFGWDWFNREPGGKQLQCNRHSNGQLTQQIKQVCVQLPTSAVNVTLLAYAAVRHASAPLLLGGRRCISTPAITLVMMTAT